MRRYIRKLDKYAKNTIFIFYVGTEEIKNSNAGS